MGKPDEVRSVSLQGDLVTTGNYFFIFIFFIFFFWGGGGGEGENFYTFIGSKLVGGGGGPDSDH